MLDGYYYHGTHSLEWQKISEDPKYLSTMIAEYNNFSRWLAARGMYFFYENKLQALRFAKTKAYKARRILGDRQIKAVVLRTKLKKDCKTLALFTSDGLHELWDGHHCYFFNSNDGIENIISDHQGYHESLIEESFSITGILPKGLTSNEIEKIAYAKRTSKQIVDEQNIESRVITDLCVKNNYDVVVGPVQENETFNEHIHNYYPKTRGTPTTSKFRGFGYDDHIEVCVLNPDTIIGLEECESLEEELRTDYDEMFYNKIVTL